MRLIAKESSLYPVMQHQPRFKVLLRGHWPEASVRIHFSGEEPSWPGDVQQACEVFWQQVTAANPSLFDGPVVALKQAGVRRGKLHLTLALTSYKKQLFSNHNAQQWQRQGRAALRANGLGVSAILRLADQKLLLICRSESQGEYPGFLDVVGGHIHPVVHSCGKGRPDVFCAIASEIRAELGIAPDEIRALTCIGLIENREILKPELIFSAHIRRDLSTIQKLLPGAAEQNEVSGVESISAHSKQIQRLLEHRSQQMTPTALGCMRLLLQKSGRWA